MMDVFDSGAQPYIFERAAPSIRVIDWRILVVFVNDRDRMID